MLKIYYHKFMMWLCSLLGFKNKAIKHGLILLALAVLRKYYEDNKNVK